MRRLKTLSDIAVNDLNAACLERKVYASNEEYGEQLVYYGCVCAMHVCVCVFNSPRFHSF